MGGIFAVTYEVFKRTIDTLHHIARFFVLNYSIDSSAPAGIELEG
jgi:hypothetical protein